MTNRTCGHGRQNRSKITQVRPVTPEPPVHRWPHEIQDPCPEREPVIHYIQCSLSYQNQLLAEIKTLLEQLTATEPEHSEKNSG